MKHIFDVEIASKYGVNAAIILENLYYWIKHNEANETNFYDGTYWTFNSRKAMKELFPYMSEKQIRTAMDKLISDGAVITGNYNKLSYDRTLWYALTEKGKSFFQNGTFQVDQKEVSKVPKGQMEIDEKSKRIAVEGKPIPDINTNINTDVNKDINQIEKSTTALPSDNAKKKSNSKDKCIIFKTFAKGNEDLEQALKDFEDMRKLIKKPMSDRAKKILVSNLEKLSTNPEIQVKILEQSIVHSWQSVYALKENNVAVAVNNSVPVDSDSDGVTDWLHQYDL